MYGFAAVGFGGHGAGKRNDCAELRTCHALNATGLEHGFLHQAFCQHILMAGNGPLDCGAT